MTTTIPRVALEVLAAIPFSFGFRPRESVVVTVIDLEPPRLTIGPSARLDLVAFDHPAAVLAVDQTLRGLARTGAAAALVTVHTDRTVGPWLLDLMDLTTALWAFPEHGGYHVHSRGAVHSYSPDGELSGVQDELELLTTQVAMAQPARSFLAGPDDFRFRRTPHGVTSARFAKRLETIQRPGEDGASWPACTALWWESVDRGRASGLDAQVLLMRALDHIPFRDGALAAVSSGMAGAVDLTRVDMDALDIPCPPDHGLLEGVYGVLASVARFAPRGRAISPLAMAAHLAWWSGDGARARVLCEQAWEEDPSNSLAGLVRDALAKACPPPWFRGRGAASREHGNRVERG